MDFRNSVMPKISIITVSYNVKHTIEETICSVINQCYPNIEYIIIDGGSTDGTVEVIKKHQDKISSWISEPDKGIYDAMNKGIERATGEWINFMNAGDTFHTLSTLSELFGKEIPSDKTVIYGDHCLLYNDRKYLLPSLPVEEIRKKIPFCHQASFTKACYLKKHPYNTAYKIAADYNSFYSIYCKNESAFYQVPLIISNYNYEDGFSIKNEINCIKESFKISNTHPSLSANLRLRVALTKAYTKKYLPSFLIKRIKESLIGKNYREIQL